MLNNGSIKNRTIFCHDNLEILKGIDSDCVDLIYLDPPFNKNKTFTAPIGSSAEGASFSDIFREEDVKDEWLLDIKEDNYFIHDLLSTVKTIGGRASYNFCYLAYMAIRLIECHRILKSTGSIYLHCDPTMSHYLKLLMDCIFDEKNYQNEVTWKRTSAHNDPKRFGRITDIIFFYTKSDDYYFDTVYLPYDQSYIDNSFRNKDERGAYKSQDLTGPGVNKQDPRWRDYHPSDSGRSWSVPKRIVKQILGDKSADDLTTAQKLDLLYDNGYIDFSKNGTPRFRSYLDDLSGVPAQSLWTDINPLSSHAKERTGYPTQKPLVLLERIIAASSPAGGIVLDPFCGCATTCVASEKLGRSWVGVDVSIKAYELVKERMKKEVERKDELFKEEVDFQTDPPVRTDMGADTRPQKYVYIISNPQYKDYFKVGIASDANRRLNSYQTSDPKRGYVLEYKFLTPNFRAIESYIHDLYKSPHEWVFEPDMQKIIKEIEGWAKD
ncbi:MAG: DNA methyltransferase [Candidatus Halichondribacter symbioticus]